MTRLFKYGFLAVCVFGGVVAAQEQQPLFRGSVTSSASSSRCRIATAGSSRRSNRRISRSATKGKRSRSPCSTTGPSRFVSSSCWTSRAAWKGTCRSCERPRNCSSRDFGRRIGHASVPSDTRSPSAPRSLWTQPNFGALPASISSDAPTPLWRAIDEAVKAFPSEEDERRVVLVLSDGKDAPAMSLRQRPGQPGGGHRSRA